MNRPTVNNRLLIVDDSKKIHADYRLILSAKKELARAQLDELEAMLLGQGVDKTEPEPEFELQFATQGQEAFEMVKQAQEIHCPFAVAFIDMRMPPGWDGIQTIKHCWEVDPQLAVVICTAYSDHTWESIMSQLGKSDRLLILKKPFDNIEVRQLAHSLVSRRHTEDELLRRTQELEEANRRLSKE